MNNVIEIWVEIPGLNGRYEVSNLGNVRATMREFTLMRRGTPVKRLKKGRAIRPTVDKDGYMRFALHSDSKTRKKYYGHRLVMLAFVGPCKDGYQVCHNDGNPANNNLDNLRYDTQRNNETDKVLHGTLLFGERHPKSVLTDDIVSEIRLLCATGESCVDMAKLLGVSKSAVTHAARGRTWRNVNVGPVLPSEVKELAHNEVVEIIARCKGGESQLSVAKSFGITQSTVSRYVRGVRRKECCECE